MRRFVGLLAVVVALLGQSSYSSFGQARNDAHGVEGTVRPLINAEDANPGEFPWAAAIYARLGGELRYQCGGSLIHPEWILTAAHCIDDVSSDQNASKRRLRSTWKRKKNAGVARRVAIRADAVKISILFGMRKQTVVMSRMPSAIKIANSMSAISQGSTERAVCDMKAIS